MRYPTTCNSVYCNSHLQLRGADDDSALTQFGFNVVVAAIGKKGQCLFNSPATHAHTRAIKRNRICGLPYPKQPTWLEQYSNEIGVFVHVFAFIQHNKRWILSGMRPRYRHESSIWCNAHTVSPPFPCIRGSGGAIQVHRIRISNPHYNNRLSSIIVIITINMCNTGGKHTIQCPFNRWNGDASALRYPPLSDVLGSHLLLSFCKAIGLISFHSGILAKQQHSQRLTHHSRIDAVML